MFMSFNQLPRLRYGEGEMSTTMKAIGAIGTIDITEVLPRLSQLPTHNIRPTEQDDPDITLPSHPVAATNTKRMQEIIAYITQTVRCIQSDFTSNLQLPARLINNISEELAEKNEDDLITNLFHLAMTGIFTPTMLEWLAETVKETTHKRWDKNINDMYHHIQTHIFVNLIPSLDRLAIATEAIRGYATFHEITGNFVSPTAFEALLDDIDGVRLLAQRLQLIIMTEHRQFRAFSKWLRLMIEIAVARPGSKAASEIEEREVPNLDEALLLAYIKDTLGRSKLTAHLEQKPALTQEHSDKDSLYDIAEVSQRGRENVIEALKKLDSLRNKDEEKATRLLNLPKQTAHLAVCTRQAIGSIIKWQSETPSESPPVNLDTVQDGEEPDL